MQYLYGSKSGTGQTLVATFDSEPQLVAYVTWAKLKSNTDGTSKFEQGSVLAGFQRWNQSPTPLTQQTSDDVFHNPSPNMM